jgi:hypothetical protein
MRRADLLGSWLLTSYTADTAGEVTHPLGPDPEGIIMYTDDGYMSAQLMRRDRPAYDRAITGGGTTEQMAADVLHHHVQVSLLPNWLGGIQVRNAQLDDETLTLSAAVTSRKGVSSTHVLVWRRPTPG